MCIHKSFNLIFKNDNYIVDKNYFTMDQDFYIEDVALIDFKEIFNSNQIYVLGTWKKTNAIIKNKFDNFNLYKLQIKNEKNNYI